MQASFAIMDAQGRIKPGGPFEQDAREMKEQNICDVYLYHNDDDMVVRDFTRNGTFEPQSLALWEQLTKERDDQVFLDIGSYTGLYTLIAWKNGNVCYAFEPNPHVHERLCLNLERNHVKSAQCAYEMAVSSVSGEVPIYRKAMSMTSAASLVNPNQSNVTEHGTVRCITIDEMVLPFNRVAGIKIDVENHEREVLLGGVKTLTQYKPTLIVECLDDKTDFIRYVMDLIGYKNHAIMDNRNVCFWD